MFKYLEDPLKDCYLDSLETIASTIHKEKNIEKVVFFILLNLIEKLNLGFLEGYFFKYDKWNRNLKHLNSYFDLKNISKKDIDFISTHLEEKINFYGTSLEPIVYGSEIQTNIKKIKNINNYKLFDIFDDFTVIPIHYENTYYGCFILDNNAESKKKFSEKELHILKLFKYNFSLYCHTRELENFEVEDLRLKTIGSFANSIIHELRTPISSIIGFASLAKKKFDDPEKLNLYLDYIIKESDKVIKLCEDIGDYSSEDENIEDRFTTFNLSEVIREVFKNLESQLAKSNIKTYLIVENEMKTTYYRKKVVTAFHHIIKNSIENCDYNKSERFISVILTKKEKNIISIKDNGIGIKKYKLNEVTIPFYSSKLYGTGMGLTIAKEVFTKLNFNFTVTSEYTQWTQITLKEEK